MQNLKEVERFSAGTRALVLQTLKKAGAGHLGGAFSIVDILSILYLNQMTIDPKNPQWEDRDRLVLSKGHAGPGLYATLARMGYFDEEIMFTLNEGKTILPSHPDRLKTPGIDATTGSLGQGVSVGVGIALGMKIEKRNNYTYIIVGDGELNEGQCWEAFQFIAHHQLDNCTIIIDNNKKQNDGSSKNIIKHFDIQRKMEAFGFETLKVKGGELEDVDAAISYCKQKKNRATCIVIDSIKGQGVPYFEELADNHSVKFNSKEIIEEADKAIELLLKKSKEDI